MRKIRFPDRWALMQSCARNVFSNIRIENSVCQGDGLYFGVFFRKKEVAATGEWVLLPPSHVKDFKKGCRCYHEKKVSDLTMRGRRRCRGRCYFFIYIFCCARRRGAWVLAGSVSARLASVYDNNNTPLKLHKIGRFGALRSWKHCIESQHSAG